MKINDYLDRGGKWREPHNPRQLAYSCGGV